MTRLRYFFCGAALLLTLSAGAQIVLPRTKMTLREAEKLVPRLMSQPVPSLGDMSTEVLDTLETQTPGVSILLMADNTWHFWRDPAVAVKGEAFKEAWNTEYASSYNVPLAALPDRINIWVCDRNNQYRCPNRTRVYSPFGTRHHRRHQGVDLPLPKGTPVYAAFSGKVRLSKYYRGYGNLVIIRHENGLETYYAHLSERKVESGQWVEAGTVVGLGGSTGRSSGSHLHFETRFKGYAFDPQWLIDFETGTLRHRLFVLKKSHLDENSRYVPESEEEEVAIYLADTREKAVADSLAAVRKAAEEKAAREAAAARYHTIRSGDTLSSLARRYGTSISAICKLNPGLTPKTTLRLGRKIRVK